MIEEVVGHVSLERIVTSRIVTEEWTRIGRVSFVMEIGIDAVEADSNLRAFRLTQRAEIWIDLRRDVDLAVCQVSKESLKAFGVRFRLKSRTPKPDDMRN